MKGEATVVTLDINDVLPNRFQPRIKFNENKIGELAESIRKYGVIQPIIVRKIGDKYEIIAGERRYKASVLAGKETIPAIINNLDDKDSSEVALIENVQREDLTPIEEAISYKKILDMGYLTQENLATKLGLSQSAVANKLRLLQLSDDVQEALLDNKISERHARSLLKLKKEDEQKKMLNRIIKERLTVRKTDEEIEKILHGNPPSEEKEKVSSEEEIEILNILNTYKEEKEKRKTNEEKENNTMNPNDPMNQFDIPEVSIMNDSPKKEAPPVPPVEPEVPKIDPTAPVVFPNVGPVPTSEPAPFSPIVEETKPAEEIRDASNPGFMDIDRIEREAVDIAQKDPVAPMSTLLQPDAMMQNSPTTENTAPEMPKGKFFDVMPSMQNAQVAEQDNTPSMFGSNGTMFGGVPSPNPAPATPSVEPSDSFSNILVDPIIQPINVPTPDQSVSVETPVSVPPTPVETPVVEPSPIFDSPIIEPIPAPNPSVNAPVEPVISEEPPKVELPELNLGNTPDIPPIEPIQVPTPPAFTPVEPVVPMEPAPGVQMPTINQTEVPSPVVPEPSSSSVLPIEKPTPVTMTTTVVPQENIRKAISVIRNATDELNRLGFIVDTDEMDLENIYQVIIKISK